MTTNLKMVLAIAFLVTGLPLATAHENNRLAGSEWSGGKKQYVRFSSGGKVSGNAGCNRFFGSYSEKAGQIKISRLGSTRMYCGQSVMRRERAFLGALSAARRYRMTRLSLKLYNARGARVLKLPRRD